MTPRRVDPLVAAMLAAQASVEAVLLRAGALPDDVPDVLQDAFLVVLVAVDSGAFVLPENERQRRAVVRAYLTTVARRQWLLVAAQRAFDAPGDDAPEATHDPRPWLEARSELRAIGDIPDDVLPLLVALSQGSDIAPTARAMGLNLTAAYASLRRFWSRRQQRARR